MKNFANKSQKLENTNLATFTANFEQKNPLNTGDNSVLKKNRTYWSMGELFILSKILYPNETSSTFFFSSSLLISSR